MSASRPPIPPSIRDESGAAVVEMALVMPLLLFLVLVMVDFGKAFNYWNDANHVAAQGARLAAVNRNPGAGGLTLQQYLVSQLDTRELREGGTTNLPAKAEVCITVPAGAVAGDPVEVSVKADYAFLRFIRASKAPSAPTVANMEGRATMRLEQAPTKFTSGCS